MSNVAKDDARKTILIDDAVKRRLVTKAVADRLRTMTTREVVAFFAPGPIRWMTQQRARALLDALQNADHCGRLPGNIIVGRDSKKGIVTISYEEMLSLLALGRDYGR